MIRILSFTCIYLCLSASLNAQSSAHRLGDLVRLCDAPKYHQFDFWIGHWDAYDEKGQLAGHNNVEVILEGCVLQEHWACTDGAVGTRFSIYDKTRKLWNQTWVSNHGTLLPIEGRFVNGAMVLYGPHVQADGVIALHRTTWTKSKNVVHQVWDFSLDGGKNWEVVFDGYLRPHTTP